MLHRKRIVRGVVQIYSVISVIIILILIGWFLISYQKQRQKMNANSEIAALHTLDILAIKQETFKNNCIRDNDNDREGEYGFIADFARDSGEFSLYRKELLNNTSVTDRGYNFCIYLPGDSHPLWRPSKSSKKMLNMQEKFWICYAWPYEDQILSERKIFVITQEGVIYYCVSKKYVGEKGPPANAAFLKGRLFDAPIGGEVTNDDEEWIRWR